MVSPSRPSNRPAQKRLRAPCLSEALESRKLLSAVPAPLTSVDVGTPTGGSASYNSSNQTYTIVGAGFDIFGGADAFHYVYEPLTGNGSVTVQVLSDMPNGSMPNGRHDLAGLCIRDSLATDAANLWIAARDDASVFVDSRATNGGSGVDEFDDALGSFPEYLKITRTGDTVVGSYSTDGGNTYTALFTTSLGFSSNTVLVGMAVSSQTAPTTDAIGTFSNFSVVSATPATVTLSAPNSSSNLTTPYQFSVTYSSPNEVNASTIGNNNWLVQLPNGTTEAATLLTTGLTNATNVTATYSVPAPTANGTYSVIAGTSPVTDLPGSVIGSGGTLGTFNVTPSDTITGLVRTPTLTPIAGALVTAGSISAITTASGAYSLSGLADGSYIVSETPPSGQQVLPHTSQSVTVSGNETLGNINFVNTAANTSGSGNNLTGVFAKPFAGAANAGAAFRSSVEVENTGTTTIKQTVNVTELLTTDGTASTAIGVLNTVPVKLNLKHGQSKTVPLSFTYPSSTTTGSYKVVAVVDSTNVVPESNKLDNVFASSAIQITGQGGTGVHFIVATLKSAPKLTSKAVKTYKFKVTYTVTGSKTNQLRIGNNNWVVLFPDGSVEATLLSSKPASKSTLIATYKIPAPTANGTYTIETSHDRAADLFGDQVAVGTIGTFTVALPKA